MREQRIVMKFVKTWDEIIEIEVSEEFRDKMINFFSIICKLYNVHRMSTSSIKDDVAVEAVKGFIDKFKLQFKQIEFKSDRSILFLTGVETIFYEHH